MAVDSGKTLAALDALIARISAAGAAAVREGALLVQAEGMRRTKVKSGTLRRSWNTETESGGGVFTAFTGPTVVYARRIELGFKGTDSAGRTYDQAPSPYVKPAEEVSRPRVRALIAARIAQALRG